MFITKLQSKITRLFWNIKETENETGLGWVATRDIPIGTIISTESPIIAVDINETTSLITKKNNNNGNNFSNDIDDNFELVKDPKRAKSAIMSKVECLSDDDKQEFFKLYYRDYASIDDHDKKEEKTRQNNEKENIAYNIFETNNVALVETSDWSTMVKQRKQRGIFLKFSRVNHSCSPNAAHFIIIDKSKKTKRTKKTKNDCYCLVVHSIRHIKKGDEIVVSSIPLDDKTAGNGNYMFYKQRQWCINDMWGFKCKCKLMCNNINVIQQSDNYISQFNTMNEFIFGTVLTKKSFVTKYGPKGKLLVSLNLFQTAKKMLKLYVQSEQVLDTNVITKALQMLTEMCLELEFYQLGIIYLQYWLQLEWYIEIYLRHATNTDNQASLSLPRKILKFYIKVLPSDQHKELLKFL